MKIDGMVHCLFEQSGTFKNQFKKLGIHAEDYDIQNNFGETDHVIDLFREIDNAYDGERSIFDGIAQGDLIVAFYPCIYFCEASKMAMELRYTNYRKLSDPQKCEKIIQRSRDRQEFYERLLRLVCVCLRGGLRLVFENPYSPLHFLTNNFVKDPSIIDRNRMERGDYFVKPTAYWFFNCEPTHGYSYQNDKEKKTIRKAKSAAKAGLCSEDRSMISPDYARNWICDFILGKEQGEFHQDSMFSEV